MTLLRDALRLIKAPNIGRPPQIMPGMGLNYGVSPVVNTQTFLAQYTAVSTLFRCVSLIAQGVAASDWQLERVRPGGEPEPVPPGHPLSVLWEDINPFYTQDEFLEVSQQHLELTGEAWWILVRNRRGIPIEIWPVRPDRMRPVPDRDTYIKGYIYQLGAERIPLEPQDVIFIRSPSPVDPYRGVGPVQSLLVDIGAEHEAAQWSRNFFRNSAQPGAVLEFDQELSDADWERIAERWKTMHQGVQNAHRVAVIERGHYIPINYNQRDMQFEQMRRLNRDLIISAFGVPLPMLGTMEAPSRANAEAAEYIFAKWVIRPRLNRIKDRLNAQLVPLFGDLSLRFQFTDPTPANEQLTVEMAERLFKSRIITLNEARADIGKPAMEEGGDDFAPLPISPFAEAGEPVERKAPVEDREERRERQMAGRWAKRLRDEANALGGYLADFFRSPTSVEHKLEPTDVAGYDWDWWTKYGPQVIEELTASFFAAVVNEWPSISPNVAQSLAVEYAQTRGARLLRLDGDLNMVNFTRRRVNELVAGTIERGDSLQKLQKALREDVAFSRERARMVARTETATAWGQGAKGAAQSQGRNEKHWLTQGDDLVEEDCLSNEAVGWIGFSEPFPTGVDTIPQHPACRCAVRFRTVPKTELGFEPIARSCPACGKKSLVLNRDGPGFWCRRCAQVVPDSYYGEVVT